MDRTEIERLCVTCAEQGLEPIFTELRDPVAMCDLARACIAAAERADAATDRTKVARLREGAERLRKGRRAAGARKRHESGAGYEELKHAAAAALAEPRLPDEIVASCMPLEDTEDTGDDQRKYPTNEGGRP